MGIIWRWIFDCLGVETVNHTIPTPFIFSAVIKALEEFEGSFWKSAAKNCAEFLLDSIIVPYRAHIVFQV